MKATQIPVSLALTVGLCRLVLLTVVFYHLSSATGSSFSSKSTSSPNDKQVDIAAAEPTVTTIGTIGTIGTTMHSRTSEHASEPAKSKFKSNSDALSVSVSVSVSVLTTGGMSYRFASDSTVWVGWSFCNQAREPDAYQALKLPSPRRAICPKITHQDNDLTYPQPIPNLAASTSIVNSDSKYVYPETPDEYARAKEVYLSHKCKDATWAVMFKSGNFDSKTEQLCKHTTSTGSTATQNSTPIIQGPFNDLPMNQPLMVQGTVKGNSTHKQYSYFAGTYDVDPYWSPFKIQLVQAALHQYTQEWMTSTTNTNTPAIPPLLQNASYMYTGWTRQKDVGLVYSSMITTSETHPWLMNYLRSNDHVFSQNPVGFGGYPWKGAGNMKGPVSVPPYSHLEAANKKLIMTIRMDILQEPANLRGLFYMPEFSGCWKKSDGSPCDPGDDNLEDNLTRYLCYGVSPKTSSPCSAKTTHACPPWHFSYELQEWVSARNNTHYPYECYHQYCGPFTHGCDPYSNPIPQELVQVKTCKEWGNYGFPTSPLQIGKAKTWHLNVGALGNAVYFYDAKHNDGKQAPPDNLPPRRWISFDVGPEVGVGSPRNPADAMTTTRWQVSEWDVRLVEDDQGEFA
ncbi:expressed unknown protein [Seminavis robusta]|uniref:DUF7705 domain-containing protein n=1 Tax=Seminavis robusta TaxID=568900 RepID=A0A9N8DC70_9STRA|nr:expressed unknown protein [Seminavis robusta]|eukprot:Sro53_g031550.1 n/a (625) ;mRNA; r:120183-122057